jgi:hypothetical protein
MPKLIFMVTERDQPWWIRHFFTDTEAALYDPDRRYDPDTVFCHDMYGHFQHEIIPQLERGHRIIYDCKNERYMRHRSLAEQFQRRPNQVMIMTSGHVPAKIKRLHIVTIPVWYWLIEAKGWRDYKLDSWEIHRDYRYKFFMQMNRRDDARDFLFDCLKKQDQTVLGLVSYRSRGIKIPDDVDCTSWEVNWQRWIYKRWVENSPFTLVPETYVDDEMPFHDENHVLLTPKTDVLHSEKIFKPIAYQHPFLLAGVQGSLRALRSHGFETFPEIFDESYDDDTNWQSRITRIVDNVVNFQWDFFHRSTVVDLPIVQEKIKHNHARFFDEQVINDMARRYLIEPFLKWTYG